MKKINLKTLFRAPQIYFFFLRIKPFTGGYAFLIFCITFLLAYSLFIRYIVDRLHQDSVDVTQTYAELMRTAISENMNYEEMNVIFDEIIQKTSNPIIVTDTAFNPIMWKNIWDGYLFLKGRLIAPDDTSETVRKLLVKKVREFRKSYEPKPLFISETQTQIGYLVFGDSDLIKSLRWVPFMGVGVVAAFIFFAYLAFRTIRLTERSNLWVGLAKETAHQLGTPISSLMGWVEFMRATSATDEGFDGPAFVKQVHTICDDMDNDLSRLRKITGRFSQIGSIPILTKADLNAVVEDAQKYLALRLPFLKKRIQIKTDFGRLPMINLNKDLMEWVLENLMKNSVDAIHHDDGHIDIQTEHVPHEGLVRIHITDNGMGISWENQKKIFSPGYTTKKRGWGLGLTLAKRIVEDYHSGQIYVNWSQKGKGTTICIDLPIGADVPKTEKAKS
jgi:signal transduction histidine kinase